MMYIGSFANFSSSFFHFAVPDNVYQKHDYYSKNMMDGWMDHVHGRPESLYIFTSTSQRSRNNKILPIRTGDSCFHRDVGSPKSRATNGYSGNRFWDIQYDGGQEKKK